MLRSAAPLVRQLPSGSEPADAALLQAIQSARGDEAFEKLVRRHGPMVLAACRRVLGNPEDAEDAFQAVFLVLTRKAATIRGNLAGWLYAVSLRTARGVRIMRERRRKHETRASARSEPAVLPETDHDIAAIVDEELAHLPEHYREAVVLCELRGLSRKQAAAELGIPEGTLSSRLAAAKRKLAARLCARGLAAPVVLATVLAPTSVSAALVEATVLAGRGTVGPVVAAAASSVVKALLFERLRAVVLAAGLVLTVVCGGWAMTGTSGGSDPAQPAPAPRLATDPATKLVEQLGAQEFADREAAQKQLRALGPKAESALRAGLRSENPEVRQRSAKVLAEIRTDALAALEKGFDPAKSEQPDHPLWKRFVSIAGDSRASRELFARIIANKKWLRTLDRANADPKTAAKVYRVGIAEVFRDFDRDPAPSPEWPCNRGEEVAYLLFLGSYPDDSPPAQLVGDEVVPKNLRNTEFLGRGIIHGEGQITHARGLALGLEGKLLDTTKGVNAGADGTDRVFARLFAAWLAQRHPASEVVPAALRIASMERVPEILPLARKIAANDYNPKRDIPPDATVAALELIAQIGARADLPLFERHFGDETKVGTEKSRWRQPLPAPNATQLRDVALGLALLLHGANPADFGFSVGKEGFTQTGGRYGIPWYADSYLGFESDEARTAAFKKAKAWLAEQKKTEKPDPAGP
jgi:RNA polymerase sigma factor (sigma-70 family)